MGFFTEVRLQPPAACRAWTAEHGCFTAVEWEAALERSSAIRFPFERARLRISEALSVEGVDSLGVLRALLIHESAASLSRAELRAVGFVHLDTASGIHLYALWRAYEFALERIASRFRLALRTTEVLRTAVPLGIWFLVFALAGFRPGLLRPLVLAAFRWVARRFGFRWSRATPILLALGADALCGFLVSFGSPRTFAEWAPGELHYVAAWGGGVLGYEWARARNFGTFGSHVALSFAAWFAVLPLDLLAGKFAPATPLLSLLTLEVLVRGGYPFLFASALLVGFGTVPGAREGLEGAALAINRGAGAVDRILVQNGFLREIPEVWALSAALLCGAGIAWVGIGLYSREGK